MSEEDVPEIFTGEWVRRGECWYAKRETLGDLPYVCGENENMVMRNGEIIIMRRGQTRKERAQFKRVLELETSDKYKRKEV